MSTDIDFNKPFQPSFGGHHDPSDAPSDPVEGSAPDGETPDAAEPNSTPAKPRKEKRAAARPTEAVSDEAKAAKAAAERDRQARKRLFAVLERHQQMVDLDADSLAVAARLLGCKADPAQVAVFSLTSTANTKALSTVESLRPAGDDPEAVMDALVAAVGVAEDKPLLRSVWALLASVDDALTAKVPSGDPIHVGRELAKTARTVAPEALERLRKIADLIA